MLLCDVCDKGFETVCQYGSPEWVCDSCFAKADALAAKEDRWPGPIHFALVKREMSKQ